MATKKRGRGWAMLKWESLCNPKGMGGLNFSSKTLCVISCLVQNIFQRVIFSSQKELTSLIMHGLVFARRSRPLKMALGRKLMTD